MYPGATHTRFEHALGAYHLACRALDALASRGALEPLTGEALQFIRIGALLHDIGHYPFSHTLEESGFTSHEEQAGAHLAELAGVLAPFHITPGDLVALFAARCDHPLARLISGPIDVDKLDYLRRDALMCGVPYGDVDVERLLSCLTVVEIDGSPTLGVVEKGLSGVETLLFAKYQMYRNVYWHHAVRSAAAMFKRLVHEALVDRAVDRAALVGSGATDEGLMHELLAVDRTGLAQALRERRLMKRALELLPRELAVPAPAWLAGDPARLARAENDLARSVGLGPAELLIDLPHKPAMLEVNLPVLRRDGGVEHLTEAGWPGRMDLPPVAASLAESACRLRVFVAREATVSKEALEEVLQG